MNWKKQRLHNLIQRLDQGNDVTLRDFKSAITSDEYEEYLYRIDWKNQINSFSYSSGYEDNLKKGIFLHNKSQSNRFSKSVRTKFSNQAQLMFEKALIELENDYIQDPSIQMSYDRQLDFSTKSGFSLSPDDMPHRVTSKSIDNISGDEASGRITKKALKRATLQISLDNFDNRSEEQKRKSTQIKNEEISGEDQGRIDILAEKLKQLKKK